MSNRDAWSVSWLERWGRPLSVCLLVASVLVLGLTLWGSR
jgi:hypothetical protein